MRPMDFLLLIILRNEAIFRYQIASKVTVSIKFNSSRVNIQILLILNEDIYQICNICNTCYFSSFFSKLSLYLEYFSIILFSKIFYK